MKLYVDDLRPAPAGSNWEVARNFHEAIYMLEKNEYEMVSLDHDIASFYGNKEMTGYDVLMWLVARKLEGGYTPSTVVVHSANPVGIAKMNDTIKKYWS